MNRPLWTSDEILQATSQTQASQCLSPFAVTGITLDSRQVKAGDLFVALKGPKFDGHEYLAEAFAKGAAGALVARDAEPLITEAATATGQQNFVVVNDVLTTLADLARAARRRSQAKVIAITGSFGKTSMKSLLHHLLHQQGSTLATEGSENNHWGVPLTLARLHPDHRYAVIEMGMNNLGEIRAHSQLVRPHIALITMTGDAHVGKLGSTEAIAQAKAEIFEGLEPGGIALLNRNDPYYGYYKDCLSFLQKSILTFGRHPGATFRYTADNTEQGGTVTVNYLNDREQCQMQTWSADWLSNVSAAAATLFTLNLDWRLACTASKEYHIPAGRGLVVPVRLKGSHQTITVLDESYNAAPQSMQSAIKTVHFMQRPKGRIIAILGDMLELGDQASYLHRALMSARYFDHMTKVYCCGPLMKTLYDILPESQKGGWAEEPQDLLTAVLSDVQPEDTYLVKGSRGQWAKRGRMAVFVDALMALGQASGE
jgi:UDP-N-acetylmuramoyl-tripeptide--D-alanyl-D-alanine ligase